MKKYFTYFFRWMAWFVGLILGVASVIFILCTMSVGFNEFIQPYIGRLVLDGISVLCAATVIGAINAFEESSRERS